MAARIHLVRPDGDIFVTACNRRSDGGGIGRTVLSFSAGKLELLGTAHDVLVTCQLCLKAMGGTPPTQGDAT